MSRWYLAWFCMMFDPLRKSALKHPIPVNVLLYLLSKCIAILMCVFCVVSALARCQLPCLYLNKIFYSWLILLLVCRPLLKLLLFWSCLVCSFFAFHFVCHLRFGSSCSALAAFDSLVFLPMLATFLALQKLHWYFMPLFIIVTLHICISYMLIILFCLLTCLPQWYLCMGYCTFWWTLGCHHYYCLFCICMFQFYACFLFLALHLLCMLWKLKIFDLIMSHIFVAISSSSASWHMSWTALCFSLWPSFDTFLLWLLHTHLKWLTLLHLVQLLLIARMNTYILPNYQFT